VYFRRTARASGAESATVYACGLVQGIALVTFPAASMILAAPGSYDLSSSQYGVLFVPQVSTAIAASLVGAGLLWPGLTRRASEKTVYLAGLLADLASMVLLIASWMVVHQHAAAFALLLVATACLGAGFGLTVPSLDTLAAAFHPAAADRSVLVLNALIGLGTALAPVFVAAFTGLGFWVGLPVLAACLLVGLIAVSLRLPLETRGGWRLSLSRRPLGLSRGRRGQRRAAGSRPGSGRRRPRARVLLAAIQRWLPGRAAYHGLPFLLAVAFVLIAVLPRDAPAAAVAAFGLAGLGCSALLPLTISFGQRRLAGSQAVVAGGVIACFQAGYGLAAFGVGPLTSAGIDLPAIFAAGAAVAVVMGGLSLLVAHRQPSPAAVHPRPARPRLLPGPAERTGEAPT
jgi:hypothetical protein